MVVLLVACSSDTAERRRVPTVDAVEWRRLPHAPTKRTEVTAATDGHRIVVAGGFAENEETVSTVEIFDPESDVWRRGPDLPVAVNHAMSAAVGGTLYVLGGYVGPGLSHPSDRIFALRGERWEEMALMPEPRAAGGAAAVGGILYVAGGIGPTGLAEELLVFDPVADSWRGLEGPPTVREHLGVAGLKGRVFVIGGRVGGADSNLAVAEAYDVAAGRWETLPEMPTARGGIGAAATANGYVIVVGGEAESTFDEAEAFDVEGNRWLSLPSMPTARHGLGVVAIGSTIYTIAGGPQPGFAFSNVLESVDLAPLRQ